MQITVSMAQLFPVGSKHFDKCELRAIALQANELETFTVNHNKYSPYRILTGGWYKNTFV